MLKRIRAFFAGHDPHDRLAPLYAALVGAARDPAWYGERRVADTIEGRFELLTALLAMALIRLDRADLKHESVWLAELFVEDMDGQIRQIGIGDLMVGKQVGKMMSALGGRLGAYRNAIEAPGQMPEVVTRNFGEAVDADWLSGELLGFWQSLAIRDDARVLAGDLG